MNNYYGEPVAATGKRAHGQAGCEFRPGRLVWSARHGLFALLVASQLLPGLASAQSFMKRAPDSQAHRPPGPDGPPRTIYVRSMLHWASAISHRPVPEGVVPPPLVPTEPASLAALVCPDNPKNCTTVVAAYSIETRNIRYRASLNFRHVLHRSFIVHEMVHFLQHLDQQSTVNKSCHQILRNEREAYGVQAAYLRRHGSIHASQVFPEMARCRPTGNGEQSPE